ncbi:glycosyltransferase [Clostridium sp. AF18-27]|uniref:glycosyltransferase family A protein n=1 Tax=Enterocloster lavalensis TaxID=460384 RepID=UPI000E53C978|nr:glycosyltransferase family 2 protein [Enterocloster lavalensis]RHR51898.1 glycosyltransferase [Clostridium sp. AF18-27]
MKLQILVSTMNQTNYGLIKKMNIKSDTLVVNQCDNTAKAAWHENNGALIQWHSFAEKGIGLSRNNALMRAEGDILLFADDDVRYRDGYKEMILSEFERYPKADVIVFNVTSTNSARPEYQIYRPHRVHFFNCLRYGAFRIAVRRTSVQKKRIYFSTLFGGGCLYGSGEDSLFLVDCIRNGLCVYASPCEIGNVNHKESTWFKGYSEKYFYDKGALFACISSFFSMPLCLQFCLRHRDICATLTIKEALNNMLRGAKEYRRHV